MLQKRDFDMSLLKIAIARLEQSGELPGEYKPHKLSGDYAGYWEAHLKSNWLLIWKAFHKENEIWFTRTGTHSDLF